VRAGLTLVEAVFALAVVAVGVVWLVSASRHAAERALSAANRTKAVTLGAGLAETMQMGFVTPGQAEGMFEGAPGFRWEARYEAPQGELSLTRCRDVMLVVFYPATTHDEERIELRFLAPGR
jgi:hypothetical protein